MGIVRNNSSFDFKKNVHQVPSQAPQHWFLQPILLPPQPGTNRLFVTISATFILEARIRTTVFTRGGK
jgi:hypothetical protein